MTVTRLIRTSAQCIAIVLALGACRSSQTPAPTSSAGEAASDRVVRFTIPPMTMAFYERWDFETHEFTDRVVVDSAVGLEALRAWLSDHQLLLDEGERAGIEQREYVERFFVRPPVGDLRWLPVIDARIADADIGKPKSQRGPSKIVFSSEEIASFTQIYIAHGRSVSAEEWSRLTGEPAS